MSPLSVWPLSPSGLTRRDSSTDLDGDLVGTLDVAVGAIGDDDVETDSGAVYVLILDLKGYAEQGQATTVTVLRHLKRRKFKFYGYPLLGKREREKRKKEVLVAAALIT